MRNIIGASISGFGLIVCLTAVSVIDRDVWNQFGFRQWLLTLLGINLTLIGGNFRAWEGFRKIGSMLVIIGIFFEAIPQLKFLLIELDQQTQYFSIQRAERNRFLIEGIRLSEESWPP